MSIDALNFNCCPRCGCDVALEDLDAEVAKLLEEKRRRERLASFPNSMKVTPGGGLALSPGRAAIFNFADKITFEHSTCSNCGTLWDRQAATKAREKREEIAKLHADIYDAIERLGQLTDGSLKITEGERARLTSLLGES